MSIIYIYNHPKNEHKFRKLVIIYNLFYIYKSFLETVHLCFLLLRDSIFVSILFIVIHSLSGFKDKG